MKTFKLTTPDEAEGITKEIYDDIIKTWGKRRLVPVWGALGNEPVLLKAVWSLVKHLKVAPTKTPKKYLFAISLITAQLTSCARCLNTHEQELIRGEKLSTEYVAKIKDYENSYNDGQLDKKLYLVLKFGEAIAFGKQITEKVWNELNEHFTQHQIQEMIVISLLDSCFARYGNTMGMFEDSYNWPEEYTPSANYRKIMSAK